MLLGSSVISCKTGGFPRDCVAGLIKMLMDLGILSGLVGDLFALTGYAGRIMGTRRRGISRSFSDASSVAARARVVPRCIALVIKGC